MFISEAAKQYGVAASTLRYYEAEGLIASKRDHNGHRTYGPEALEQLRFVLEAKQLGLSLPEIVELSGTVMQKSCTQVRETLKPQLMQRLEEVDQRIATLQTLRQRIITATDNVAQCPDSEDRCKSECAFLAASPATTSAACPHQSSSNEQSRPTAPT